MNNQNKNRTLLSKTSDTKPAKPSMRKSPTKPLSRKPSMAKSLSKPQSRKTSATKPSPTNQQSTKPSPTNPQPTNPQPTATKSRKTSATKPPYPTPNVAVDAVMFSIQHERLHVLMIQIKSGFFDEAWALPGGLVRIDETLEWAVKRILFEKTQVKDVYLEQLYSFGDIDRDPRSRTISIAYYALIDDPNKYAIKQSDYYSDIQWFPVNNLPEEIAFDHRHIVQVAHDRLKERIMNSSIAASLVPDLFTFSRLQKVYEAILGEELDKRNFRKRMLAMDLVRKTHHKEEGMPHRPAWLYEFRK